MPSIDRSVLRFSGTTKIELCKNTRILMASFLFLHMRKGHYFMSLHPADFDSTMHNSRYSASKLAQKPSFVLAIPTNK
jgi:hypothetical protein